MNVHFKDALPSVAGIPSSPNGLALGLLRGPPSLSLFAPFIGASMSAGLKRKKVHRNIIKRIGRHSLGGLQLTYVPV